MAEQSSELEMRIQQWIEAIILEAKQEMVEEVKQLKELFMAAIGGETRKGKVPAELEKERNAGESHSRDPACKDLNSPKQFEVDDGSKNHEENWGKTGFHYPRTMMVVRTMRKIGTEGHDCCRTSYETLMKSFNWLFKNRKKENLFANRLCDLFSVKHNGLIDFGDFVRSFNVFHPNASQEDKIDFSFKLYDLGNTGFIEHQEVKQMLIALLCKFGMKLADEESK